MPSSDHLPGASGRGRVAYVVKRFPRLSETFVLNECLELERQGIEVEIFSLLSPPPEPRHDLLRDLKARVTYLDDVDEGAGDMARLAAGYETFFLGKSAAAKARLIAKAHRVATRASALGCAHVHAHFGSDATTVAALAADAMGVGYSYTAHAKDIYHTYVDDETDARVRAAKIRHAAFVVTVSEYNAAHLARLCGTEDQTKIVRLYNGIDLKRFEVASREERDGASILAVGRLVEKKGYGDLIAALALLRSQVPALRCVICGEGSERAAIERQVSDLDLGSVVTLLGAVDQSEIIAHMKRATVLALPAVVTATGDRDALPTVLLEAQAMGLPVVSTPVCGIPEIIAHEETGLLVPERDPEALADALLRLMTDAALRDCLARSGRRNAERQFDLKASVRTLAALFRSAMALPPVRPALQHAWAARSAVDVSQPHARG